MLKSTMESIHNAMEKSGGLCQQIGTANSNEERDPRVDALPTMKKGGLAMIQSQLPANWRHVTD